MTSNSTTVPPAAAVAQPGRTEAERLRDRVIEEMARVGNDCLHELGYHPGIKRDLHEMKIVNARLQTKNEKLYEDNVKLWRVVAMQNDRLQSVPSQTASGQYVADLEEQVRVLKMENEELSRKHSGLLASQGDNSGNGYRKLVNDFRELAGRYQSALGEVEFLRRQCARIQGQNVPGNPIVPILPTQPSQPQNVPQQVPRPGPVLPSQDRSSSEGLPRKEKSSSPQQRRASEGIPQPQLPGPTMSRILGWPPPVLPPMAASSSSLDGAVPQILPKKIVSEPHPVIQPNSETSSAHSVAFPKEKTPPLVAASPDRRIEVECKPSPNEDVLPPKRSGDEIWYDSEGLGSYGSPTKKPRLDSERIPETETLHQNSPPNANEDIDMISEDDDSTDNIGADGLVSVDYCIACLFDENDAGEQLCRLCLARYEHDPGPDKLAPSPFIRPAVETLVTHCEQEHTSAWELIRNPSSLAPSDP